MCLTGKLKMIPASKVQYQYTSRCYSKVFKTRLFQSVLYFSLLVFLLDLSFERSLWVFCNAFSSVIYHVDIMAVLAMTFLKRAKYHLASTCKGFI